MGIPEVCDAVAAMQQQQQPSQDATCNATRQHSSSSNANNDDDDDDSGGGGVGRWSTTHDGDNDASAASRRERALVLLERGIDICENVGGARTHNVQVLHLLRSLYAARFELMNGSEHLPRPVYATQQQHHRAILAQSSRLLYYNDAWDRQNVQQFDTACVLVAHFVRAYCVLHQRPFNAQVAAQQHTTTSSNSSSNVHKGSTWSMCVGGQDAPGDVFTLAHALERVEELLALAQRAVGADAKPKCSSNNSSNVQADALQWCVPKLLMLKCLLQLVGSGDMYAAQQTLDDAVQAAYAMTSHASVLVDSICGRRHPQELGLLLLARAELAARVFDWCGNEHDSSSASSSKDASVLRVDGAVVRAFDAAAAFYTMQYDTELQADGIMSPAHVRERSFEVQAYAACQLSYANFLLSAPRHAAAAGSGDSRAATALLARDTPVFLPGQLFTLNPLLTAATPPSSRIYRTPGECTALPLPQCRKRAAAALERALQLNRLLFVDATADNHNSSSNNNSSGSSHARQNAQAAWTLLAMACTYADTRDYLYATGLFESAAKAMVYTYGAHSPEVLLLRKLRYEYLAGVGSEQEAAAASHEIVQLLRHADALPCPS